MSKQSWRQTLEEKERREREREEQARLEKQKKLEQLKNELSTDSNKEVIIFLLYVLYLY